MIHSPATRAARGAALFAAVAIVLAACTGSASPTPTSAPSGAASGTTYTVNMTSGAVGNFLTGEDGKTLYIKKDDTTSQTNCTGGCLTNWPPFTLDTGEQVAAGTGVTGTLATFQRPEGQTQVTYNGHPLYYFAKDTKAGDTLGQGVGGVWSVANP